MWYNVSALCGVWFFAHCFPMRLGQYDTNILTARHFNFSIKQSESQFRPRGILSRTPLDNQPLQASMCVLGMRAGYVAVVVECGEAWVCGDGRIFKLVDL